MIYMKDTPTIKGMKIGLEIHVQLTTESKLFCGCPNKFTREPNTYVCETCLGFPGSKPRLNRKAVDYAIKIGIALNCKLNPEMFFSRKSYFYPDMSKNFQITQYEMPLCNEGFIEINGTKIRITRVQIEEDPARIIHIGPIEHAKYILVDYNRSGTPLCEIVTEPDFSSPQEARTFLQELSSMMEYLGVYDSSIEGSMRVDANLSLPKNSRVEIKNISGFKEVEKALNYEAVRQNILIRRNQKVLRETRGWNADSGVTISLRSKEEEEDYGYIYETDLPSVTIIDKANELRYDIPEFAKKKTDRYETELRIGRDMALAITNEPDLAEAFETVIMTEHSETIDPHLAAVFFSKILKKVLNYENIRLKQTGIRTEWLINIIKRIKNKEITERTAELLLRDMVLKPQDPDILLKLRGLTRIDNKNALEPIIMNTLKENSMAIIDYKHGNKEALEFLVGQVMRKTQGRADPVTTRKIILDKLDK